MVLGCCQRIARRAVAVVAVVSLFAPRLAMAATRLFNAGSLIIPADNCYQGDVAQITVPKDLDSTAYGGSGASNLDSSACAGSSASNSVMGNGARRAYGLIWLLLKAGVPVYWIIDPQKDTAGKGVDSPDLTIGACSGNSDAVMLVDPSLPASYCGLDSLHPMNPPPSATGQPGFPSQCAGGSGTHPNTGVIPLLNNGGHVSQIEYRGGPFVIDAKDAATARDVMAWYFAAPPAATNGAGPLLPNAQNVYYQNGSIALGPGPNDLGSLAPSLVRPYTNPWTYLDNGGSALPAYGAQNQFYDPGHQPLHWSDYTPSAMVPYYPAQAYSLDVGAHSIIWPCMDPCMCPYTTWDPLNPNGYVDPWAGTLGANHFSTSFSGPTSQNAITFATVNVHQAQVSFMAPVGKVFTTPMAPIALLGMTDPVHLNTFRFYMEEAGLTFGPCKGPPGTWFSSTGLQSNPNGGGQPAGYDDLFFDPNHYPYPTTGGINNHEPSTLQVTCAEGLVTSDPTLADFVDANADTDVPPAQVAPYGGPYGQVLDVIAPEPRALQGILGTDSSGNPGCGAPAYQEVWVPHWDAYLCSGPTTRGCPLASASSCPPGSGGDGCPNNPVYGWDLLDSPNFPAKPVQPGQTANPGTKCSLMDTGTDGYDPYCPQLVQMTLNALQTYVWKGGNLLAECVGAASLEDVTMRYLLGEWGINQQITHFMSEWQPNNNGLSDYYPSQTFYAVNNETTQGGLPPPVLSGDSNLTDDCIDVPVDVCDNQGSTADLCSYTTSNTTTGPYGAVSAGTPSYSGMGWAGPQVSPSDGPAGTSSPSNQAVLLLPQAPGGGPIDPSSRLTFQVNGGGGQDPGDPPAWNSETTYTTGNQVRPSTPNGFVYTAISGTATGGDEPAWPTTLDATVTQTSGSGSVIWQCTNLALHIVEYAPPAYPNVQGLPYANLYDPMLQIGDFYFEGIFGATESWNQGYESSMGYAYGDTLPLIRGLPANRGGWNSAETSPNSGPYYGDYWVKNHNSGNNGESGTVVYLAGDSYDGRPDGLRMLWSSMLNLGFVPTSAEMARSSSAAFEPTTSLGFHTGTLVQPGEYLFQGTFVARTLPPGVSTSFNNSAQDLATWAFPETMGHFRQYDLEDTRSCLTLTGSGTLNNGQAGCESAVTGQGSNTTNYAGPGVVKNNWDFWDSSGADPANLNWSLLTNSDPTQAVSHRVLFTHLYQPLGSGVGVRPVWLNPQNAAYQGLSCALFPTTCGSSANVACPDGVHCVVGPLACDGCGVGSNLNSVRPPITSVTNGTCSDATSCKGSDVGGLLYDVVNETGGGGCTPLLTDSCFGAGTPQVQCLDKCWGQCYSQCDAQSVVPPFNCQAGNFDIGKCAQDCTKGCNGNHGQGVGGGDCGVGQANSPANFRQLCFPSLGGVDHSTPVIVGPPPASLPETYLKDPTVSGPAAPTYDAHGRPTVAYVGAADGMLHAIFIDDGPPGSTDACAKNYVPGQEIWAFMPNQQLPGLRTNGTCAQSLFVDGVPVVKDVLADLGDGRGPQWHTILTETEGVGGNHVFALDVTDPMAPVRVAGCNPAAMTSQSYVNNVRIVLWEDGDPLDSYEMRPQLRATASGPSNTPYLWPGQSNGAYTDDVTHEGPGFPASALPQPTPSFTPPGTFNHYLGPSQSVFMGQLLGSGSEQNVTYVAGQGALTDGYGRAITLPPATTGGNPKDFTAPGAGLFGPEGEVVYAFDSATGVPRTQTTAVNGTPTTVVEHFTERYFTKGPGIYRSNGNNDTPAPALGVTLDGQPQTEMLVVPDLDGQVWGLFPGTLASYRTIAYGGNPAAAFPLFDIQRYRAGGADFTGCTGGGFATALAATAQNGSLTQSAAFANPAAFLPPGTCQGFTDPVVLLATGGVDWGPPASIVVALDIAPSNDNLSGCTATSLGSCQAGTNDSAAAPMPIQGDACMPLEVATCEGGISPSSSQCEGRVFGQPLVLGQDVLFTTSTGNLTGVGGDLPQQQGSGNIEALGAANCTAATPGGCGICLSTEQTADLATNVGKVGSGLAAAQTSAPNSGLSTTTYQVFSSSTTGLGSISVQANNSAVAFYQRVVLQQWWLRHQPRTPQ